MTETIPTLQAQVRERTGTRDTDRLRKAGDLPMVIYGHKKDPLHVSTNGKQLIRTMKDHPHVLQFEVGGENIYCQVKDLQWNHMSSEVIHVDLQRVNLDEKIKVTVDLHLVGDAVGLKVGGSRLDHSKHKITIAGEAGKIPNDINCDITNLAGGAAIYTNELPLPEGIELAEKEGKSVICRIHVKGGGGPAKKEEEAAAE